MIFISGNVASSKNSKRIVRKGLVINSQTVMNYKKRTEWDWQLHRDEFLASLEGKQKPYRLGLYFIRDSKRRFDYLNAAQLPLDIMQKYGWLDDDNADEVIPVFLGYHVDKDNAGLEISLL